MDNVSRVGGGKYTIKNPINGIIINPPSRGWVYGKEEDFWKAVKQGIIMFQDNDKLPIFKRYLHDNELQLLDSVFYKDRRGAKIRLRSLMNGEFFDFPKDEEVIKNLISAFSKKKSLILDFFSGSATTAHAIMQLNSEDGGNRKFIMVQLPEKTEEKSEAFKAGYKNICEIGKERIRRAGKKIKEESPLTTQDLDTGFRVLKLDSTNMQDIYYSPKDISQADLFSQVDNVKPDRTGEDLLFQVMLELGATLDSKIETTTVAGKTIYNVAEGYLVACFDPDVTDDVVKTIAQMQPAYAVLRDTSMKDDSTATNFEQIFKTYSPDTVTKIL